MNTKRSVPVSDVLAPWIAGLVLAAPVLVAYYPPMTDLPFHEAAIGILRHFSDPSMVPAGLYRRNLGEPNQLFHMIGWALSYVVSTRWAVKIVVAGAVVAIPVCAARFARHVGASPLAALVVAPMALGWLFSWGLVANLLGLAALLAVLPLLDRLAEAPSPARALAAFAGALLVYSAHQAMLVVYSGMALALAALHRGPWRARLLRASPFLAGAALSWAQARWQTRFMTPVISALPTFWHPLRYKLTRLPYIILPATEGAVKASMLLISAFLIGSFIWLRARERTLGSAPLADPAAPGRAERARVWLLRWRWELFSLACFAAYLAFPQTLNGATLVYQRFFPPAYAILVVAAAPRDLWTRAALATRVVVLALPAATLLVAWPAFIDSDHQYRALAAFDGLIEPGSAIAEIDLGPGDPTRNFSLGPAAGRLIATHGGRLAYSFAASPISPVVVRRRYQWNESLIRLGFDCWLLRPEQDLRRFRYLVVRTNDPKLAWLATYSLRPEAEYVAESEEWVLFRSTLPVIPLTSPDAPLEDPSRHNLRERINRLVATLHTAMQVAIPPEPSPGPVMPHDGEQAL